MIDRSSRHLGLFGWASGKNKLPNVLSGIEMKFLRRIALLLWRDEGQIDTWTQKASSDYNRSLLGRTKDFWGRNPYSLFRFVRWIGPAIIAAAATLGAVWLADYLNTSEAGDQVQTDARQLLMQCIEKEDGVYACREVSRGNNKVIAGPGNKSGDKNIPPQKTANE